MSWKSFGTCSEYSSPQNGSSVLKAVAVLVGRGGGRRGEGWGEEGGGVGGEGGCVCGKWRGGGG